MSFFADDVSNRNHKLLIRLSSEEREFLRTEAKRRGVKVTTLVRECFRKQLLEGKRP